MNRTRPGPADGVAFGERIAQLAAAHGPEVALVEVRTDAERTLTWRELDRQAERVAGVWHARGLTVGSVVAVSLPNRLEHLVGCAAAWKLGAVPVALRWDLPEWERGRLLEVLRPDLVLDDAHLRTLPADEQGRPEAGRVLPAAVSPQRFGVSTSGSTGTPKVVLQAEPGRVEPSQVSTSAVVEAYGTICGPQVLLVANALYHSSSITTATFNVMAGNRTVLLRRFSPELLQAAVVRWAITGFMAPTPQLLRLARWPGLDPSAFTSLQWVQHGGSPLPEWLGRFWTGFLGPERFFTSYGSAESIGVVACRGDEWLAHPGTLGRGVLGTEVAVLDDAGRRVAPRTVGTIFMRRPGGPSGRYAGLGVAPLEVRDDGFATVGDLGWLEEDGFVFLADRREDLIVTGGANVYPAEVEAAIGEHPGVADVVVVGVPDDEWGRRVHAIVEPAPGANVSEDGLRAFARERLAPYKVPKRVELVARIPRSEATKVNRRQLSEERALRGD